MIYSNLKAIDLSVYAPIFSLNYWSSFWITREHQPVT